MSNLVTREINKLRSRLRDHPEVLETDYYIGDEKAGITVTFENLIVPGLFHEIFGLEFVAAWETRERYRLREYLARRRRMRALFWYSGEENRGEDA